MLHARGALLLNVILEHASPVLGSGLGKIGQVGDQGTLARARPVALGGAGHGQLISPGGAGHGALFSAPPAPLPTLLQQL